MKSAIIYRGPSMIDGQPIIAIATGLSGSGNRKTGNMVQTWILRDDMTPSEAVNSGADASICGDCPHRGDVVNGKNVGRSCYVLEFQAPASIYRSVQRGNVPEVTEPAALADLGADRVVRLGAYGDPAAVPVHIWSALLERAAGHTGYTHQWKKAGFFGLARYCMASCDTADEQQQAVAAGWRTFRIRTRNSRPLRGEVSCPASEEAGKKLQCEQCLACGGADGRKGTITIIAHGSTARAKHALQRVV
jgi:hypothetical protein